MSLLPISVEVDMQLSAETIADARKAVDQPYGPQAYGALQAHCEILASQLERAHAALAPADLILRGDADLVPARHAYLTSPGDKL